MVERLKGGMQGGEKKGWVWPKYRMESRIKFHHKIMGR